MYSPSLELIKNGETKPECEVDFVWIVPNSQREKISIILGECKDQGPIPLDEFKEDVENLRRVMDALPSTRFKTFALFSKLSAFTPEEIALAKSLNRQYDLRVILLTDRELEPYHVYERTEKEFEIKRHGGTPEDMALVTAQIYFSDQPQAASFPVTAEIVPANKQT